MSMYNYGGLSIDNYYVNLMQSLTAALSVPMAIIANPLPGLMMGASGWLEHYSASMLQTEGWMGGASSVSRQLLRGMAKQADWVFLNAV